MIKRKKASAESVTVTFVVGPDECDQPLSVVGDFNSWDPLASPLRKRSNGTRSVSVELPVGGSYRFKYLADGGQWFCDSAADGYEHTDSGTVDSLLLT